MPRDDRPLSIAVGEGTVSALWSAPARPKAVVTLAHGAGGGMTHRFLAAVAAGLKERDIATLRFNFPYMEAGRSGVDPPARAAATVRAAATTAANLRPALPIFAGGKSFGGRMTSTAASEAPLDGVIGLFFLGFPLHAPGKPSKERAAHLASVTVPMLFLQGTRDDFAQLELLKPVVKKLGARAKLVLFDDADHSFHVPKASGRTDAEIFDAMIDALEAWIVRLLPG